MLFDLRGRGRRRTVRIIYASLALLMGGGLVLFGVGGATSGGLLDAFKNNTGTSSSPAYSKQISKDEKLVKVNPKNIAAWADLTKVRLQDAQATGYDQNAQAFTDDGKTKLARADTAWKAYLALNPKKVDILLAKLMVQAYQPTALNQPDDAVAADEYVIEGQTKSSASDYLLYTQLAYAANQTRKADLAGAKAVSLAPPSSRTAVRTAVAQLKSAAQQATQQATQQAAQSQTPPGTSIVTTKSKNGKLITTTTKNGKTSTSSKPAPKKK